MMMMMAEEAEGEMMTLGRWSSLIYHAYHLEYCMHAVQGSDLPKFWLQIIKSYKLELGIGL